MSLLQVGNVAFGYAGDALFSDVTFRLEPGERAALVAPNGAGKSTLLRIVAGELAADSGLCVVRKEARVGYYRQSHELPADGTVLDVFLAEFAELTVLRKDLAAAQVEAASGERDVLDRLADLTDRYQHAGGHEMEHRVEVIASRLGFATQDLERHVESLSGGERGRVRLGVVLATEPDLLLLDEPTNHLDLQTIEWLERHLVSMRSAALVVSHDRAFLDAVCPTTLELGRRQLREYPLAFSAYHEARAEDLERERELAAQQAAFVEKTEDFIRRNIAGQKTKQAQARRKMLDKLDRVEGPEDVWAVAGRVRFRFAPAPRSGDIVLEAKGLGADRGERTLFSGLDLLIRRGDRIGVVGRNGSGKTTLLRLLAGEGSPEDTGHVRRGTNLVEGYFDQHLGSLDATRSCIAEVRSIRGDFNEDGARSYLARFRFWGDDPFRRVASLSGGERSRLALAKLLLEPRNLLFLDEPTNHLDVPAAEILEEALVGFEGTVVLVSHDRRFLENVTTRTLSIGEGMVDVYEGGYRDYQEMLVRRERAASEADAERRAREESERRRARADEGTAGGKRRDERRAAREFERKTRRVKELERAVEQGEQQLSELRARLRQAPGEDWEALSKMAGRERALAAEVERNVNEWERLSTEVARAGGAAPGATDGDA